MLTEPLRHEREFYDLADEDAPWELLDAGDDERATDQRWRRPARRRRTGRYHRPVAVVMQGLSAGEIFDLAFELGGDDELTSPLLPGFSVAVPEVFRS